MSDEREALARLERAANAVSDQRNSSDGTVDNSAIDALTDAVWPVLRLAAGWRRSPQPADPQRVAEIRARLEATRAAWHTSRTSHDCQSSACDHPSHRAAERAARTFGLHADPDIAYLLSLIPGGDR